VGVAQALVRVPDRDRGLAPGRVLEVEVGVDRGLVVEVAQALVRVLVVAQEVGVAQVVPVWIG
jgi:hypothetical protein